MDGGIRVPAESTACYVWRPTRREGAAPNHGGCLDASSSHLGSHGARDRARDPVTRAVRDRRPTGYRGSMSPGSTRRRPRRPPVDRGAEARPRGKRPSWRHRQGPGASAARGGGPLAPTVLPTPFDGVGDIALVSPADPTGAPRGHQPSRGGERPHGVLRPGGGRARPASTTPLPRQPTARRCRRLRPEGVLRPVPAAFRLGVRLREQHPELPVPRR